MARARSGVTNRRRHKKILKLAKGYWGGRHRLFRPANETVMRALWYAYRDRRNRKRDFRRLWITRVNAAARLNGLTYSRFMNGLRRAGVRVNRKMLADLAVRDPEAFRALVEKAKAVL
ncbi:MAG: 50S ribosomal protein L20 [Clostridia bacterium]|nr:50S ribosomal protein L20 [Clostridia bacterium]